MGHADRAGPARLAHRVLRDEHDPARAVVRHPHRRRRPHLPAPRGRDRPERGGDRPAVRRDVAALRPPPDGWRKMAKSTGNIARVGELLAAGVSPRALRSRSSRSTTGRGSTTRTNRCAAVGRSDRPARRRRRGALAAYREDAGRTIRRCRPCWRAPARRSAPRSTTTSTCRRAGRRVRPRARPQPAHRARDRCRRRMRPGRSMRCATGRAWASCPTRGGLEPAVAALLGARATARASRDFAASDRLRDELAAPASPSRTPVTGNAGGGPWRPAVADRPRRGDARAAGATSKPRPTRRRAGRKPDAARPAGDRRGEPGPSVAARSGNPGGGRARHGGAPTRDRCGAHGRSRRSRPRARVPRRGGPAPRSSGARTAVRRRAAATPAIGDRRPCAPVPTRPGRGPVVVATGGRRRPAVRRGTPSVVRTRPPCPCRRAPNRAAPSRRCGPPRPAPRRRPRRTAPSRTARPARRPRTPHDRPDRGPRFRAGAAPDRGRGRAAFRAGPGPAPTPSLPGPDLLGPDEELVAGRRPVEEVFAAGGPPTGCSSCPSDATRSSSSSCTRPGCASRSSRSRADR